MGLKAEVAADPKRALAVVFNAPFEDAPPVTDGAVPVAEYHAAGARAANVARISGELAALGLVSWRSCYPEPEAEAEFGCSYCKRKACECHKSTAPEFKVKPPAPSAARKASRKASARKASARKASARKVRWAPRDWVKTYNPMSPAAL